MARYSPSALAIAVIGSTKVMLYQVYKENYFVKKRPRNSEIPKSGD